MPQHWSNFIVETCQYFESLDQSLTQNAFQKQLIVLEFLTIVPEDVSTAQLIGGRKSVFHLLIFSMLQISKYLIFWRMLGYRFCKR